MKQTDIDNLRVGDWCFLNTPSGKRSHIGLRLHDGDNGLAILPINAPHGTSWNWNGNEDAPTLTPSILHWGAGRNNPATWHGYLTDGKLVGA